jgi:FlaA1/EpsC-like NDP-sugar epimerase
MSIAEAAQLVLQAGAMGTGGDVFVLDMGEPVRIVDLARRMIRLSGYEMDADKTVSDHIDIEFIGLRPGEKLHEELLLGDNVEGTGHPMIMRAEEESLPYDQIELLLKEMQACCDSMDCDGISSILSSAVSGFGNHKVRYDHMWLKQGMMASPAVAKMVSGDPVPASNVQELFPDKS